MKRAILLLCSPALAFMAAGQAATPSATLDDNIIRIGEQTALRMSITCATGSSAPRIIWPVIGDTITGKVEVVHLEPVDTVPPGPNDDPGLVHQTRTVVLTSFDTGFWAIPPFQFVVNGDTVGTSPLLLTVQGVEVDTTQAFRDIKDIYELPFSWAWWFREHWPWIAGGAAVVAALVVLIIRLRKRPQATAQPVITATEPLHVRTLNALEAVGARKLWQQGMVKQHHSEVTDILRGYIEQRYAVPALERTTDELMRELGLSSMTAMHREQVANLLRLADMVKFAKWNPSPTENEHLLLGAMQLVRDTAPNDTTDAARS